MKDKSKYDQQTGPVVSKNAYHQNKEGTMRSSSRTKQQQQQQQQQHQPTHAKTNSKGDNRQNPTGDEEGDKKFEVGIVEIASNLSDLSGSTGDVDSNPDVKQLSTRNADVKEFEILIQAKHAEACKAMGVSFISFLLA